MLTILTKSFICDAWIGAEHASASRYNTAFKIQEEISLSAGKDGIILKFRSVN